MQRQRTLSVTTLMVAVLVLLFATPAQAQTQTERNKAAMSAIIGGTYTTADLALIRSQPTLAAQVPDPTNVQVIAGTNKPARASTVSAAAVTYCNDYWVTEIQKSLLGSIIFKWQKFVRLCYNGTTTRSLVERYSWLPAQQGMVQVREYSANSTSGLLTWQWTSMLQRHLQYCVVKYGCYADVYPWVKMKIYGNGTWWYDGAPS